MERRLKIRHFYADAAVLDRKGRALQAGEKVRRAEAACVTHRYVHANVICSVDSAKGFSGVNSMIFCK